MGLKNEGKLSRGVHSRNAAVKVKRYEDGGDLLSKLLADKPHSYVKLSICDIDGVMRGKQIRKEKIDSAMKSGIGFSDVVAGWDIKDKLYEHGQVSSWDTGYGDVLVDLDASTCRCDPFDSDSLLMIGELGGRLKSICPRSTLRRVVEHAGTLGLSANVACEYEFVVLDETPETVRQKMFDKLSPVSRSVQAYSLLETSVMHSFFQEILDAGSRMGIPIEAIHPESGEGVYEVALKHGEPLSAADNAALFKLAVKSVALRRGWLATFMPKLGRAQPGQGAHLHISLMNLEKTPLFYEPGAPGHIGNILRYFVGGIQRLMPELMCMTVPTINGFKRLVPDSWAPINLEWGIENRTCGLRVIGDSASSMHVEFRISGGDINPYIAISAVLGAGVWGIENRVEPRQPVDGNAYKVSQSECVQMPTSLSESVRRFKASQIAKDLFGEEFVRHFALSREWEVSQYAQHISTWELDRYLVSI